MKLTLLLRYTIIFIVAFIGLQVVAQESVFYTERPNIDTLQSDLGISIQNLNGIKNKEYFNYITDGETILGTQLHPEFFYKASPKISLYAGAFLYKNYGQDRLDKVIPTFTMHYVTGKHTLTFGNLDARDNHKMIEPMLGNEKVLSETVLETGFSYEFTTQKQHLEAWIDWENFIEPLADDREIFTIGLSYDYTIFNHQNHTITGHLQHLYYHEGGQINKKERFSDEPDISLKVNLNSTTIGASYTYAISDRAQLFTSLYILSSATNDGNDTFPFPNGKGFYGFAGYRITDWTIFAGYFAADGFTAAKSNPIFNTLSTKVNNNSFNGIPDERYTGHKEKDRTLFFTRVQYKKNIAKNIAIGLQGALYYQRNDAFLEDYAFLGNEKGQLDYNYGVFATFSNIFGF